MEVASFQGFCETLCTALNQSSSFGSLSTCHSYQYVCTCILQCVQRTLDMLVSQGKLVEKVYGKQKVYMANQDHFPEVAPAELKEMEKKISELQARLKEETSQCRALESRMCSYVLIPYIHVHVL